jgi:hypothetical protein
MFTYHIILTTTDYGYPEVDTFATDSRAIALSWLRTRDCSVDIQVSMRSH